MNYLLEGILTWPGRARHARGFGIHSPYAFSLVTGVLRDTASGYYAYGRLAETARRHGRTVREARSVYRLLLHLRSVAGDACSVSGEGFGAEIAAIAFPEGPARGAARILLYDSFRGDAAAAAEYARGVLGEGPAAVLLTGIGRSADARELRRLLAADSSAAMVFDGWHSLLAVSRRGLPAQRFGVLFPR